MQYTAINQNPHDIMQKSANQCVKCAKCVPECTIYTINRDEITSPRGYLDLIQSYAQNRVSLDLNLKNAIESCFLCTTCVTNCPFNLPIDFVVQRARVDIAKKYGIAFYKKILFSLLGNRKVLNIMFKFGFYFNPCIAKKNKNLNILRFNLSFLQNKKIDKSTKHLQIKSTKKRAIPPLNKLSFLQKYDECIKTNENSQTIGIFIGCLSNYHYVNVGHSLVKILQKLNYNIKIFKKQECCGAPAFFSGDIKNTTKLIKKNIDYFYESINEIEAILVPEATCASMVLIDWSHALEIEEEIDKVDNSKYKTMLETIKQKTFMASFWLRNNTNLKNILKEPKEKLNITYHDPCHARKTLKIFKEPRELLAKNNIIEMRGSNECCGFGGITIQSENYSLAKIIGNKKAQNIKNTNAQIVSAECSACRMQINDSMYRNDVKNVSFLHPLEIIANDI